ncbi:MAG: TolC family protein [Candidatus Omnitrophica bacterium]|nr:TolC family protein [Candidatus Omnitrophota bacterium]
MKRAVFSFLIFCLLAPSPAVAGAIHGEPLSLTDAYRLALKRSEDLAVKKEAVEEAEVHFMQALSGILPSGHYVITRKEQDSSGTSGSDTTTATSLRRRTPEQKFVFSQPIFSGFKEFAAMQGAAAEKKEREYEKRHAEETLFIDVVESFYAAKEAGDDARILGAIRRAMETRMKELRQRVGIGRSRQSEWQASLSDLKLLEADEEDARRTFILAKQLLEFYIGEPFRGEFAEEDALYSKKNLSDYLAKTEHRADVKALEEARVFSDKKAQAAWGGYLPTVKVDGNYYTERVGVQSGIDWDVLLTVDVPIFEGTKTAGDVKEAASRSQAAKKNLEKGRRLAELDVRNAYSAFLFSQRRARILTEAARAAEENYLLNAEDYRRNLVNNLDVLDALRTDQDVSRKLNEARYQMKKDYWKLLVAAGEGPSFAEASEGRH